MRIEIRRALYGLATAGLVSILGVLYMQTRELDFDSNIAFLNALRQLKQVDAQWNVDVLRAKTGLASNYDQVASPLPLIDTLKRTLAVKSEDLWHNRFQSNARLTKVLDDYSRLMDRKTAAIEQFKSQNAILRNSSRFLPVAASDLEEVTRNSTASASGKAEIAQQLNTVLADIMSYALAPEDALRDRIVASTQQLETLTTPLSPDVRERAATFSTHVNTVLRQQARGGQLLAELSALPTAAAIDDLSDANSQEREKVLKGQTAYRQALFAYSVFLLLLLGFVARQLFRNYSLLNSTNSALNKTNLELKESQVQLVQSEKMSALGQMVAGIAHEINTPLAYVKATFSVLGDQLAPLQELANLSYGFTRGMRAAVRDKVAVNSQFLRLEESARDIIEHGILQEMTTLMKDGIHGFDQISEIVLNLKNFSRLDREKISDFSVQAGLDSTLLLASNLIKNKVEIRKDYGNVPNIGGSPSQINQVFLNIITNAVHAMPQRSLPNIIVLRTAMENAATVRIEIQDNGSGIPEEVLPKIFDPFFTTKPIGQGTGMGLSISFKIIQEHGGKLLVDTEADIGTVFTILLPVKAVQESITAVTNDALLMA